MLVWRFAVVGVFVTSKIRGLCGSVSPLFRPFGVPLSLGCKIAKIALYARFTGCRRFWLFSGRYYGACYFP